MRGKKFLVGLLALMALPALFLVLTRDAQASTAGRSAAIKYQTHVQTVGWQKEVSNGATAGTTGRALRLEGLKASLDLKGYTGGVEYQTHVQYIGWQNKAKNGVMAGTTGQSLRMEAVRMNLYGEVAQDYSICYRVHAQSFGWLGWACDGESAGTATYGYRAEAIQIKLMKKSEGDPYEKLGRAEPYKNRIVQYQTHVQSIGWQDWKSNGQTAGTSGRSLRLESMMIKLGDIYPMTGGIQYRTHVQSIGWQGWKSNGQMAGTTGQSLRLEAIEIKLTGPLAQLYDVSYRVHVQSIGWQDWKSNGEMAGTTGRSLRLEAIEIKVTPKAGGMGARDPAYDEQQQGGSNTGGTGENTGGDAGGNIGETNNENDDENSTEQQGAGSQGQNEPQPPLEETEEEKKNVKTPTVAEIDPKWGYYDLTLNVKFEPQNYYVEGFEVQTAPDLSQCATATSCVPSDYAMTYNKFWTNKDGEVVGFNDVDLGLIVNKNENLDKQYVRVRAYREIDGVRYYSNYTEPVEVEYNRISVDLAGGEAMNVWTVGQSDGVKIGPERQYYTYGVKYKLVTPTKQGHKFAGWTGSNVETPEMEVTIPAGTTGELSYQAHWTELSEEDYLTLATPTLVRQAPTSNDARVSMDLGLRMYYEDADYYVNEFEVYTSDTEDGEYTRVSNNYDYTYLKNYYDENAGKLMVNDYSVNIAVPSNSTVRYYKVRAKNNDSDFAKYSAFSEPIRVEGGHVALNPNGGQMQTYITEDGTPQIRENGQLHLYGQEYRLVNPVREGYTFLGWIDMSTGTLNKDVVISADTVGDLSYIALWTEGGEPATVAAPKLTEIPTEFAYPGRQLIVGYESYADWANGFEMYYANAADGDYQPYDSMVGCYVRSWGTNVRVGSLKMSCGLSSTVSSDLYLKARAYKVIDGVKVYSDLSAEYAYIHVQPVDFDMNGGEMPDGGMGALASEDPTFALFPNATGYIPGFKYEIVAPVRSGYTFVGWTGSNGNTPQKDFIIGKNVDEPLHYKANWVKN